MIQHRPKVRMNTPQYLEYQFRRPDRSIIDLSAYTSVSVETKLQGQEFTAVAAAFLDKLAGKVYKDSLSFTAAGVWDVQFYCVNSATGAKLFGEPIQITVVKNVENLDADEITQY